MNFGKAFKIRIPWREKCMADSVIMDYAFSIFTDGPNTKTSTSWAK